MSPAHGRPARGGRPVGAASLGAFYLLAGLPLGTFGDVVPVLLRREHLTLEALGTFSLLYLPYSGKALLAPLIDCSGRLRHWLAASAAAVALAYTTLSLIMLDFRRGPFALALLTMTCASATYDIALDAMFAASLEGASNQRHGQANAWRLTAFKTSMVLVGSAGVLCGERYGFAVVFAFLAASHTVLACWALWALPAAAPRNRARPADWLAKGVAWLRLPAIRRVFLLALVYKLSIATHLWMERAFWLDNGLSLADIGLAAGICGLVGTLFGANAASRLTHRFGLSALLVTGLLVQGGLGLVYLGLAASEPTRVGLCFGLFVSGITFGVSTAALMNLITRVCRSGHAATQFAALTGAYALARSFGGAVAGQVAGSFGFPALFLTCAALVVPGLVVLLGVPFWPRFAGGVHWLTTATTDDLLPVGPTSRA